MNIFFSPHEMGLGKTLTAVVSVALLGCDAAVVVRSVTHCVPKARRAGEWRMTEAGCSAEPSGLDRLLMLAFRHAVQQQTGGVHDSRRGFDGMLSELRDFQRTHTRAEQASCSEQVMSSLAGPIPWIFRHVLAPRAEAPFVLAVCTRMALRFLVGEMTLTQLSADESHGGGLLVSRCRVVEESGCKGLCVHMCKLPTERWFATRWGVPVHMEPNFETLECQIKFGTTPPPNELANAPALQGCLSSCPLLDGGQTDSLASPVPSRADEI